MIKLFLGLFFLSSSLYAQEVKLENYLKLQESLAADDFKTSLSHHKLLCEKEVAVSKQGYKDCQKDFKNIEQLRDSFKNLSDVYLKYANKDELKQLTTASCPMAGAKWIQRNGSLRNPYYGKSMLECGEKI